MIGPFIVLFCILSLLTGFIINLLIETYKEKENKSTKILGWLATVSSFALVIISYVTSVYKIRDQAIIDYTKGKYKVNIELRIDTLRTVTKEPDISVIYENYLRQHSRL